MIDCWLLVYWGAGLAKRSFCHMLCTPSIGPRLLNHMCALDLMPPDCSPDCYITCVHWSSGSLSSARDAACNVTGPCLQWTNAYRCGCRLRLALAISIPRPIQCRTEHCAAACQNVICSWEGSAQASTQICMHWFRPNMCRSQQI